MPIKESELTESNPELEHPLAIKFGEKVLNVVYLPLTTERVNSGGVAMQLSKILKSWDMTNGSDHPIPITYEYLAKRPLPFLNRISEAIEADYFPK